MRSSNGAQSLDRRFYVDSNIFAKEQQEIFSKYWIMLDRTADFPLCEKSISASFKTYEVAGMPLIVTRSSVGGYRGFHNVCRHRGAMLLSCREGCLENGMLTCPYHAWSYNSAGDLIGAPNMQGVDGFQRENFGLAPISVAEGHGFLFANLALDSGALSTSLENVWNHFSDWSVGELSVGARLEYDVRANWKLLFENYSECYHCPTVHPALNRLTPYRGSDNEISSGPILGGPMHLAQGIETMSSSGKFVREPLPKLEGSRRRNVYYFTVFPSFFLSLHPDYVLVHRIEPRAVDSTHIVCDLLVVDRDEPDLESQLRPAVDFWDLTNRQDWEMCERVQLGARSPNFRSGPLSNLESIVAAFDRHYLDVMGA